MMKNVITVIILSNAVFDHIKDIISYINSRLQIKLNRFSEQEIIVSRERVRNLKLW